MQITITEPAHNWFVEEYDLEEGDAIRFLGKLYGKTEVHDNYSVGTQVAQPQEPLAQTKMNGITYFAEQYDEWFFSGYDFIIDYEKNTNDIIYRFIPNT